VPDLRSILKKNGQARPPLSILEWSIAMRITRVFTALAAPLLSIASAAALETAMTVLFGNAASAFAQSAVATQPTTNAGATMWVTTTQRIKSKIYENARLSQHPVLVVVVHGDSPDEPPTYQYRFAERAAAVMSDTVVAAVLRPGYSDGEDSSDGMRGYTTGDNWTPEVVNAVATVLSELKDRYHPRRAILVGHSGGAAIVGDLLGQQGTAVDGALLVSCPCDVAEWRKHMQSIKEGAIWERPVRSLSPLALVDRVPASAKIWLLVGSDDQTTPSALTLAYAEALRNRNVAAHVTIAPGLGHNILLEPIAMERLLEVASTISGVPDQGVPVPAVAPAVIDRAALAALVGTYRFAFSSSRDGRVPTQFGGLGIEIAVQDGLLKVVSPITDAPAARAGVMANDVVTHLDDEATQGMTVTRALDKMRGPVDTKIRLRIVRKGLDEPIELTVVRALIRPPVAGADLQVAVKDGKLQIDASGPLPVLDFEKGSPIAVVPVSRDEFVADGGDHTRLAFLRDEVGKGTALVLNPGPWQIMGQRIN
jgi:pimeloyl-ACP methyl ester carboxylesterase